MEPSFSPPCLLERRVGPFEGRERGVCPGGHQCLTLSNEGDGKDVSVAKLRRIDDGQKGGWLALASQGIYSAVILEETSMF